MTTSIDTPFQRGYAGMAGALYLIIIVFGVFSEGFVRATLVVPGDASLTAANILASEGMFRLGFAADSIMALCDVALAVLLYVLLRPLNRTLALLAMVFRLIQTSILGVNLLNHYAALLVLNGGVSLGAFNPDQLNAAAMLWLDLHSHGYDLGLLFFGINSVVVGYLLFKAPGVPRALGVMMMAAGAVYLTGSYLRFLVPGGVEAFAPAYVVPLVGESAFCLWLLLRGFGFGPRRNRPESVAVDA